MRLKVIMVALSLSVVVTLLTIWIGLPSKKAATPTTGVRQNGRLPSHHEEPAPQHHASIVEPRASGSDRDEAAGGAMAGGADDVFRRKWDADRQLLGPRHQELEELWSEGRAGRGTQQGIEKLEQLLSKFPNTNRAGCAALELGHQYIHNRKQDLQSGRESARKYWNLAIARYGDAICEHNASVAARAKLGLAAWVYRYTDRELGRKLLNEVIDQAQQESTPVSRTPPAITARGLLDTVFADD